MPASLEASQASPVQCSRVQLYFHFSDISLLHTPCHRHRLHSPLPHYHQMDQCFKIRYKKIGFLFQTVLPSDHYLHCKRQEKLHHSATAALFLFNIVCQEVEMGFREEDIGVSRPLKSFIFLSFTPLGKTMPCHIYYIPARYCILPSPARDFDMHKFFRQRDSHFKPIFLFIMAFISFDDMLAARCRLRVESIFSIFVEVISRLSLLILYIFFFFFARYIIGFQRALTCTYFRCAFCFSWQGWVLAAQLHDAASVIAIFPSTRLCLPVLLRFYSLLYCFSNLNSRQHHHHWGRRRSHCRSYASPALQPTETIIKRRFIISFSLLCARLKVIYTFKNHCMLQKLPLPLQDIFL